MLKFKITNWCDTRLVDASIVKYLNEATKTVSTFIKSKIDLYFEVIIVDKIAIRKLNKNYRKVDKVTDVLTFALWDAKQTFKTELLGEIYLCPDFINEICKKDKKYFDYEITLTFVHGLLHLLGFDHRNKKEEQLMFKIQEKIAGDLF